MDNNENFIHIKQGWVCWTFDPQPMIYNLFVEAEYRNKGFARKLIRMAKREIDSVIHGVGVIQIQANPNEQGIDTQRLIEFYQQEGLYVVH